MTKKIEPVQNAQEENPKATRVDELTKELAQLLQDTMVAFSAKVSEEFGSEHQSGIMPYIRSIEGGAFKPDAKVVILQVKQENNDDSAKDTGASGESEGVARGAEPAEAPVVAG